MTQPPLSILLREEKKVSPTSEKIWFRWSLPSQVDRTRELLGNHIEAVSRADAREQLRARYGHHVSGEARITPAPHYVPSPKKV